jgi:hypothetical protein
LLPCVASAQIPFPTNPPAPAPAQSPGTPTPTPTSTPPAATAPAPAAAPAPIPSISFEVKAMRTGGSSDLKLGGATSSSGVASTLDRTKVSKLDIEIALRSFSNREGAATVEWFFFSTPQPGIGFQGNEILLFSQGTQEVLMKPGATEKIVAASGSAVTVESRRAETETQVTGSRVETVQRFGGGKNGQKIAGWMVRLRAGEKVLGFKASSPRFEVYARDPNALGALVGKDAVRPPAQNLGSPWLKPVNIPPSRNGK